MTDIALQSHLARRRHLARQVRQATKLEALLRQIPVEQLAPLVSDMKTVGIAYEAGTNYQAVAKRLASKYQGRRRKLFDGLIQNKHFGRLLDHFVESYAYAADQPIQPTELADTQEGE